MGSPRDLEPCLKDNDYTIGEQFKDKVLMPGPIDPHMHSTLGAIALQTACIMPKLWDVMGRMSVSAGPILSFVSEGARNCLLYCVVQ